MLTIQNVFKKLQGIIRGIIGTTLMVMMCIIFAQTFTRYIIFHSLPWSEELSRYLFVLLVLLGANIGITDNLMVNIDIVDNFLNKGVKKIFVYARLIIGVVVNAFFFYSTFEMIKIGKFQVSPAMQIPMSVMYTILAVGFFLVILAAIMKIIETAMAKEGSEG